VINQLLTRIRDRVRGPPLSMPNRDGFASQFRMAAFNETVKALNRPFIKCPSKDQIAFPAATQIFEKISDEFWIA
jgi:hypothetical protein